MVAALAPGHSGKELGKDYGYKGYGLTFVLYASTSFEIRSVKDGKESLMRVNGALDWLASSQSDEASMPKVDWLLEDQPTISPNGTTVTVTLASGTYHSKMRALSALDHIFEWAQTPKPLEYVLRLRTAVGNTARLFGRQPSPDVVVETTVDSHPPTQIPYKYLMADECDYIQTKYYSSVADYLKVYEDGALSRDAKLYRGLRHTYENHSVGVTGPVGFSAAVMICGKTGMTKLAAHFGIDDSLSNYNELLLSTGVQLALGNMPLGISIEDWQNVGHDWARYFVLLDADLGISDQLDSGRKGISRYFANLMISDLVASFRARELGSEGKLSLLKLGQMMSEPGNQDNTNVAQLADRVTSRVAQNAALQVSGVLKYEPEDENEVIVLFTQLVATDMLPGYEIVVISQGTMYDSAMTFSLGRDHPHFSFRQHPLGLGTRPEALAEDDASDTYKWRDTKSIDWFVVEFKPLMQDLLSNEKQRLSEIDLLICWDYDETWIENHGASLEVVRNDTRVFFGATHRLNYDAASCDVIVLKEVVQQWLTWQSSQNQQGTP